jgi:signal transduction histidine kinase
VVYLAGVLGLWFLLAGIHPVYFSLLLALYPQIFRHLRLSQAIPAAAALSAAVVWREVLASGRPLWENPGAIVGGLLSVVFGSLFALWITRIIEQSHERRGLIGQLEATRGELAAAEREGGRLAERQRLARDIHDTLAQGFVSIVLQLQAAEAELPDGAEAARGHLERARRTARDNLAEARRLVWDLRPEALAAAPLGEALGRLTGRLAEETGMVATATVTGTPTPLSADAEVTLLRVTQEALANVSRHAHADRVAVTLSYMDGEAALDVRDDGDGFTPAADGYGPDGGLGLHGMRERVEALGGRLAVETTPGQGTTIAVTVPSRREGPGDPLGVPR